MHPVCGDAVAVAGAGGAGVVGAWGDSGGGGGVPMDQPESAFAEPGVRVQGGVCDYAGEDSGGGIGAGVARVIGGLGTGGFPAPTLRTGIFGDSYAPVRLEERLFAKINRFLAHGCGLTSSLNFPSSHSSTAF